MEGAASLCSGTREVGWGPHDPSVGAEPDVSLLPWPTLRQTLKGNVFFLVHQRA